MEAYSSVINNVSLILAFLLLLSHSPYYLIPASWNPPLQQAPHTYVLFLDSAFKDLLPIEAAQHNQEQEVAQRAGLSDSQESEISASDEAHVKQNEIQDYHCGSPVLSKYTLAQI